MHTESTGQCSNHLIYKAIFVFSLAILVASSAYAFGGGGKSRKSSVYRGTGVDSIGVHIGGNGGGKNIENSITRFECEEQRKFWCHISGTCVADETACFAECPADRLCGSGANQVCCGTGNICVDNSYCCAYDEEEDVVDNTLCCDVGSVGYNASQGECCPTGTWLSSAEYAGSSSGSGSGYIQAQCCPNDSEGLAAADGRCCEADEALLGNYWCCPKGTTEFSMSTGCCTPDRVKEYFDDVVACCDAGTTPYCAQRDMDGKCISTGCCDGEITEGVGYNGADVCCQTGDKGYCYGRNNDASCYGSGCCIPEHLTEFDGTGVCCSEGTTPYCYQRNADGVCQYTNCCYTQYGNTMTDFDNVTACCSSYSAPYCMLYNREGKCTRAECSNHGSTCTPTCINEYENGVCQASACCPANSVGYCSYRDEDGNCTSTSCCPQDQNILCANEDENGVCLMAACCNKGYTLYCNYRDRGRCGAPGCCDGTVYENMGNSSGGDLCCHKGEAAYCSRRDIDGNCTEYRCGPENCNISCTEEYENGVCERSMCCEQGSTAYCANRFSYGCVYDCCNGTVYKGKGRDGADVCCPTGQTPYCTQRDQNGNCMYTSCCAGTVTSNLVIDGPDICFSENFTGCKTNEDCNQFGDNNYCSLSADYVGGATSPTMGSCKQIGDYIDSNEEDRITSLLGVVRRSINNNMASWWAAMNWCSAQNMRAITVNELDCYADTYRFGNQSQGNCCAYGYSCGDWRNYWNENVMDSEHEAEYSPVIVALREFGVIYSWTGNTLGNGRANAILMDYYSHIMNTLNEYPGYPVLCVPND